MYHVDISKLNGKIAEKATTKEQLAKQIGINRTTLIRRLKNGKLLVGDAHIICRALNLSASEAVDIFLATQ
jgi:predicted DNA-binding protein (UPF0251 family)